MNPRSKFPDNFYWGSATSSHQIEGDNDNDWTDWEKSEKRIKNLERRGLNPKDFISGKACDSYNRFIEDLDIAKNLNHKIHRFSIEWSRIEPEEGKFDYREIDHYKKVVDAILERGMVPMVTLWHFTLPKWVAKKGGVLNSSFPDWFVRFIKVLVPEFKDRVELWITFNEPVIYGAQVYIKGEWLNEIDKRSIWNYLLARKNFIKAHRLAYQEIKKIYSQIDSSPIISSPLSHMSHNVQVGIAENNSYIITGPSLWQKIKGILYKRFRNNFFLLNSIRSRCDFIGLNYYHLDRRFGPWKRPDGTSVDPGMLWEIYPEGIYHCLKELWARYKKPIYITENGSANSGDEERIRYIKDHLYWVRQAIGEGADIRGYMYWSLLDNFEWAKGYGLRFGLVEIDYATQTRKIRGAALEYAKICKDNSL